jgi:hypothetical protein
MAHGLRRRPAVRRAGIGLVLFAATVGCHGPDKSATGNPPPAPRLPSTLPAPKIGQSDQATPTAGRAAPPVTTAGNGQNFAPLGEEFTSRGGLTPAGVGQTAPVAAPTLPTTGGTLRPTPPAPPPNPAAEPPPPVSPLSPPAYPPQVLRDPIPPDPPAASGANGTPVGPPTSSSVIAVPALPPTTENSTSASGPIAAPAGPLGPVGN